MKGCVFAGTFDPITVGHEQIINKSLSVYGRVLVVVGKNPKKTSFLSEEDRVALVKAAFDGLENVAVVAYSQVENGYADFLKDSGYTVYVRGIRNQADLQMENAMKQVNAKLYPFIQTDYVYAEGEVAQVSSSLVRQLIAEGKDWLHLIPPKAKSLAKKIVDRLNKQ